MKKLLIIFLLLSACNTIKEENKTSLKKNFEDKTLDEFKIKLEEYEIYMNPI